MLFIIVLYFWKNSKVPDNSYEIYFSGGADIETGRIVINTNYFKGIPEVYRNKGLSQIKKDNSIKILITNLNNENIKVHD